MTESQFTTSHVTEDFELGATGALSTSCVQLAEAHWKDCLVGRGDRSVWSTTPSDFGEWGIGIELYFTFTRAFAIVSGIVAVLYLPLLVLCCSGDAISSLDISAAGHIAKVVSWSMVPNMGRIISTENSTNSAISTDFTNTTGFSSSSQLDYSDRKVVIFGNDSDIRDVTFVMGILDSIASLVILCTAWWFELVVIPRVVRRHRAQYVTPDIYAVFVDCLPKRLFGGGGQEKYALRLQQHFALLLAAQVTTKSARKRLRVVHINDQGGPVETHKVRCCCCCRRHTGYDTKGRRIGCIVSKTGASCVVQWLGPASPVGVFERKKRFRLSNGEEDGDLLDASLLWHLESFGLEAKPLAESQAAMHSVHLQRDFKESLGNMRTQAKRQERDFESKLRVAHQKTKRVTMLPKLAKTIARQTSDVDEEDLCLEERDVVGAFIIFSHVRERNFIYAEYQSSRTPLRLLLRLPRLMFCGECLRVLEAPPPTDVFWENLDFPFTKKFGQKVKVFLICLLMCLSVILVIAVARNKAESASSLSSFDCNGGVDDHPNCVCHLAGFNNVLADRPPGINAQCSTWLKTLAESYAWWFLSSIISILVILFAGFIVGHLARLDRPSSITAFNKKVMLMTTIIYVLALGMIRVLINAKWPFSIFGLFGDGRYADLEPEWYIYVGTSVTMTLALNSFFPILEMLRGPSSQIWIWLRKGKQRLMTDLLDLYTPPLFPFALRHAEQLAQLFACLTFCGGMPVLAIFMFVTLSLHYWCDKYVFLRSTKTPPRYKHHLMLWQVRLLQIAIWWHTSFSTWVYANRSAPSHCIICDSNDGFWGHISRNSKGERVAEPLVEKMFRLSSIPSALVGSTVFVITFLRVLLASLGRGLHQIKCCRRQGSERFARLSQMFIQATSTTISVDDEATFLAEMPAMKRQGIHTHYDVQHMPGFEFLRPRGETQDGLLQKAFGIEGSRETPAASKLGAPVVDKDTGLASYDLRKHLHAGDSETRAPLLTAAPEHGFSRTAEKKGVSKLDIPQRFHQAPMPQRLGPVDSVKSNSSNSSKGPTYYDEPFLEGHARAKARTKRRPRSSAQGAGVGGPAPVGTKVRRHAHPDAPEWKEMSSIPIGKTNSARADFAGGARPRAKAAPSGVYHATRSLEVDEGTFQQDMEAARARLGLHSPRSRSPRTNLAPSPCHSPRSVASDSASARQRSQTKLAESKGKGKGRVGRPMMRRQSSLSDTELDVGRFRKLDTHRAARMF